MIEPAAPVPPERKIVAVTSIPVLGAPDDQQTAVPSEGMSCAEHVTVRGRHGSCNQRVRSHVINSRLAEIAAGFLLGRPVLVAAKQNDLAVVAVWNERGVDSKNL